MTEADQIRTDVASARRRLPHLATDFADRAIAVGKTSSQVKGELIEMMSTSPRERAKALMRAECERQGLTRPDNGSAEVAVASDPRGRAKALMAAEVRRQGMVPKP